MTDYLLIGAILLLVVVSGAYVAMRWSAYSEDEKRLAISELVRAADQMIVGEGKGQERMEFVLHELQHRYPGAPVRVLRYMVEAAVNHVRSSVRGGEVTLISSDDGQGVDDEAARWN